MKERPILFNADMVNAILAGRKTQTRRVIKGVGPDNWLEGASNHVVHATNKCPYGQPGDRLWVREAFSNRRVDNSPGDVVYRADHPGESTVPGSYGRSWKPSIHMPRWASRITLEIVSVRVERLLSISDEDAIAEGCYTDDEYSDMAGGADVWPCQICDGYQVHEHGSLAGASEVDCHSCNSPKKRFSQLWQSINGFDSWDANPWVWVVEFRRVEP